MHLKSVAQLAAMATLIAMSAVFSAAAPATGKSVVDLASYADALRRFVTPAGQVRYAALKADPVTLDAFLAGLAAGDPGGLATLPDADRIAFWINAYNAITLKTIITNYPIHASGFSALRYPASSIRQISGAWSNRDWTVLGAKMSLEDIEHKTLRKQFKEPRVHMALVCAALGCPVLRQEPYQGERLGGQLDEQARRYLASTAGLVVEFDRGRIAISAIFKWFTADFAAAGGVRTFLTRYAPESARAAIADEHTRITYLDYDWALNEAQGD